MKCWALAVIALLPLPAAAQFNGCAAGFCAPVGTTATYTGPGDVVSFNVWGGVRAYTTATRGTKAIQVCDNAGANCSDVNTDATTGLLSNPGTHGANNCNTSDTCLVAKVYDKVGTNDWVQATAANMPQLVHNALNTSYGIKCTGGSTVKLVGANLGYAQAFTIAVVGKRTTGAAISSIFTGDNGTGNGQLGFDGANTAFIYSGTVVDVTSVADNAFHSINTSINGASTIYNIDGATATINPGASGMGAGTSAICQSGNDNNNLTGFVMETGAIASSENATVLGNLNTNAHAAYGSW